MVVYPGYFLRDCLLPSPSGLFSDDDRYHADVAQFVELVDARGLRFGYGSSYHADCVAGKLQCREHRQTDQQTAVL